MAMSTVKMLTPLPRYSDPAQLSVYKSLRSRPLLAARLAARRRSEGGEEDGRDGAGRSRACAGVCPGSKRAARGRAAGEGRSAALPSSPSTLHPSPSLTHLLAGRGYGGRHRPRLARRFKPGAAVVDAQGCRLRGLASALGRGRGDDGRRPARGQGSHGAGRSGTVGRGHSAPLPAARPHPVTAPRRCRRCPQCAPGRSQAGPRPWARWRAALRGERGRDAGDCGPNAHSTQCASARRQLGSVEGARGRHRRVVAFPPISSPRPRPVRPCRATGNDDGPPPAEAPTPTPATPTPPTAPTPPPPEGKSATAIVTGAISVVIGVRSGGWWMAGGAGGGDPDDPSLLSFSDRLPRPRVRAQQPGRRIVAAAAGSVRIVRQRSGDGRAGRRCGRGRGGRGGEKREACAAAARGGRAGRRQRLPRARACEEEGSRADPERWHAWSRAAHCARHSCRPKQAPTPLVPRLRALRIG